MDSPTDSALALQKEIEALLPGRLPRVEVHAALGSTQDRARELALSGAPEGSLIVALEQTAGRGRQGRSFYSPAGTGVYMSLVLRPRSLERPEEITITAAVATARAVESVTGERARIKWVNDVYLRGKKVSGILTEGGLLPNGSPWAALGVGVNLLPPEGGFPAELRETVGALAEESGARALRGPLIARIAEGYLTLYADANGDELLREYRERDVLRGRMLDIIQGERTRQAVVLGVSEDFGLRVRDAGGEEETLRSGEVHLRPARGETTWQQKLP